MAAPRSREPRSGMAPPGRAGEPPVLDELVEAWRLAPREEDRQELFRAIFTRYYRRLFQLFAGRGLPGDDLAQETLLRVYNSMEQLRGEARFDTWLYRVAMNVLHNELRAQKAHKRSGSEVSLSTANEPSTEATQTWSHEPPQVSSLLDEERQALLRNAIQTLPPQMRSCLLLRIDQDLQYREIAALLRISIDTVKVHLFQARQRLRAALRDYFEDIDV